MKFWTLALTICGCWLLACNIHNDQTELRVGPRSVDDFEFTISSDKRRLDISTKGYRRTIDLNATTLLDTQEFVALNPVRSNLAATADRLAQQLNFKESKGLAWQEARFVDHTAIHGRPYYAAASQGVLFEVNVGDERYLLKFFKNCAPNCGSHIVREEVLTAKAIAYADPQAAASTYAIGKLHAGGALENEFVLKKLMPGTTIKSLIEEVDQVFKGLIQEHGIESARRRIIGTPAGLALLETYMKVADFVDVLSARGLAVIDMNPANILTDRWREGLENMRISVIDGELKHINSLSRSELMRANIHSVIGKIEEPTWISNLKRTILGRGLNTPEIHPALKSLLLDEVFPKAFLSSKCHP